MSTYLLVLVHVSSSAQLLVVQCGGTNDRFGRLHIDILPRLHATIELVANATANRRTVRVLTSGGLNETLHLRLIDCHLLPDFDLLVLCFFNRLQDFPEGGHVVFVLTGEAEDPLRLR